jgi:anti-anti-sigma factor
MAKEKSTAKRPSKSGVAVDGAQIALYRKLKNWTQEDLAEKSGVALRTIQHAEASDSIDPQNLHDIAKALGVPPFFLIPNRPESIAPQVEPPVNKRITVKFGLLTFEFPLSIEEFMKGGYHIRFFQDLKDNGLLDGGVSFPTAMTGSIIVAGELAKDAASEIASAFINEELSHLHLESITFYPSGHLAQGPSTLANSEQGVPTRANKTAPSDQQDSHKVEGPILPHPSVVKQIIENTVVLEFTDIQSLEDAERDLMMAAQGHFNDRILLDCGGLKYLTNAGISTLIRFNVRVQSAGGKLVLCNLNERIQETLGMIGVPGFTASQRAPQAFLRGHDGVW